MTNPLAAGTTALPAHVGSLQHDLQRIRRRFGRPCRGQGNGLVKLVRQTAQHLLAAGRQLLPLVHATGTHWPEAKIFLRRNESAWLPSGRWPWQRSNGLPTNLDA
jgi:hypothetical protein